MFELWPERHGQAINHADIYENSPLQMEKFLKLSVFSFSFYGETICGGNFTERIALISSVLLTDKHHYG